MNRQNSVCGRVLGVAVLALGLWGANPGAFAAPEVQVAVLGVPPEADASAFYVGNRPPLLASPLIKLPIGSIRPEGWLRNQLQFEADGMTGHLTEISKWCKFEGNAWVSKTGQGHSGWEELPYWLKGFYDLGLVLQDQRILTEARRWVEGVLASQRPDGYFGDQANLKNHDLWPNMAMMYALRSHYEATGDEQVIKFLTNYCRWMSKLPRDQFLPESWQKDRAGDNLDSIYWLYNRTGESWLLDLARVNHERTADWTAGIASWHGVNISQCFREPGEYYQQTRDPAHLKAAERNYDTVIGMYGQVPGGLFGSDEVCRERYVGPRQGTETCTIVEFMHSFEMLAKITGQAVWLDRCEELAHNSLPASMTPDLKGLHYLTAANAIQLDRSNKAPLIGNGGDMLTYTPYEQYRCCQHNVAMGWPYYAEHLWMATGEHGLAAVIYAASQVKAKVGDGTEVTITETSDYPFSDVVELKLSTPKEVKFPLLLRVPGWCQGLKVQINGEAVDAQARPLAWVKLDRTWKQGDTVRLELPMKITATVWKRNQNAVSVSYGPLTFSLKIGERWDRYNDPKLWAAYEVLPTTPWNYGLIVDPQDPPRLFEIVKRSGPLPAQPFTPDNAPISLKAAGKRIPQWKTEPNGLVGMLQMSPVRSDQPTDEITLIPMGCTRLRIAAFPRIGDGEQANLWSIPTASHVSNFLSALNDGIEPKNSRDGDIPRFTWWPNKGTTEWVEYSYGEPRKISSCEVYWFEDKEGCRPPVSWKVLITGLDDWKEVAGASPYEVKKDAYSRVTFDPVTVKSVRIEAKLQPGFSAGILEWRVGG